MAEHPTSEISLVRGPASHQLAVITTGTMTLSIGRLVISPLLPTITESFAISSFQAGIALSALFGISALCRYPGGRLSDVLTRKTVIVGGLGVAVLGFGLLARVVDYTTFILALVAVGIGGGFYTATAVAHLSDLFDRRQGQALGINNGSIYVAGIFGAVLANTILALDDWRIAFVPIAGMLLVLLLLFHRLNEESYVIARPEFEPIETFTRIFSSSQVRGMLVVGVLFGGTWQGVITFLPTFLQAEKAFAPRLATSLFALLFFVGIFANVGSGRLSDRFEIPYVASAVISIAVLGLTVVILAKSILVLVAGIVILGIGLAAIWPVLQAYMMQLFPSESKGGDYGVFSAVYVGIASIGPSLVGFVGEQAGFTVAFGLLVGCLLASLVLALRLARQ